MVIPLTPDRHATLDVAALAQALLIFNPNAGQKLGVFALRG